MSPTPDHVFGWVRYTRPLLRCAAAPAAPAGAPPVGAMAAAAPAAAPSTGGPADAIRDQVLAIVAEQTGYPPEMLDTDLDLEADLGIDTVKQAETFAAVREAYGIPREENIQLREFPTLDHVIGWVLDKRPDLSGAAAEASAPAAPEAAPAAAEPGRTLRRVPVAVVRPGLERCVPTGVELAEGRRVVVALDGGGVGSALVGRLEKLGVTPLVLDGAPSEEELLGQLDGWLADGPIHGVYWLPALDVEPAIGDMDVAAWREHLRARVKLLYTTLRRLYDEIAAPDRFLVCATRLGGRHGYDGDGALAPMGGAVSGFAKTLKRERADALVKVVDFAGNRKTAALADHLIEETLRDPGIVEVGYPDDDSGRWGIGLVEREAGEAKAGLELNDASVVVVTGAAGSIVSAILTSLASSGATFHLLDLAPAPPSDDPDVAMFATDPDGLKRRIAERIAASGERATPVKINKALAGLERQAAARGAIEAIERAGGTVHYHQLDLRDAEAVGAVVDRVRQDHGKIDLLLHAAGLEISRFLPDKAPEEFDLVFGVKADGWFNLLRSAEGLPIGATVAFASIAGRFGNAGQADYAAANDLLCKFATSFRRTRPETRGIAIDWTAWADIGMAARGSIPQMMAQARIDMLPPADGIPVIGRELTAGTRGELVIAGSLGVLLEPFHETGGLDPEAFEPNGLMAPRPATMTPEGSLVVEATLDPKEQPFLYDHAIDGTPVLPGVMGIEAFAEATRFLAPPDEVVAIEDVEFLAPFKFYRNEPRTVRVEVRVTQGEDGWVGECRLLGSRVLHGRDEPQITTHFTARVRLGGEPSALEGATPPPAAVDRTLAREPIYKVYFHGPAYQVIDEVWPMDGGVVGRLAGELPPDLHPADAPLAAAPRLVELCFQTAGVLEIGATGRMGLPRHIDRVRIARAAPHGRLGAVVRADNGAFDAQVVDENGTVLVELRGYRTEILGEVDEPLRKPLQEVLS
ncbi:MAG: SDR family NAD(P)-dependent oxidoreductase [Sandaracinaceae bacterium]